jgi:hypothetical protein
VSAFREQKQVRVKILTASIGRCSGTLYLYSHRPDAQKHDPAKAERSWLWEGAGGLADFLIDLPGPGFVVAKENDDKFSELHSVFGLAP